MGLEIELQGSDAIETGRNYGEAGWGTSHCGHDDMLIAVRGFIF
jgi:hypothetical protein